MHALMPGLRAGVERVPGLTWRPVANVDDVAAVLADGSRQRSTAATAMNSSSSRSHAILSVKICADPATGACSLLHLVDLAGTCVSPDAHSPQAIPALSLPTMVQKFPSQDLRLCVRISTNPATCGAALLGHLSHNEVG